MRYDVPFYVTIEADTQDQAWELANAIALPDDMHDVLIGEPVLLDDDTEGNQDD